MIRHTRQAVLYPLTAESRTHTEHEWPVNAGTPEYKAWRWKIVSNPKLFLGGKRTISCTD